MGNKIMSLLALSPFKFKTGFVGFYVNLPFPLCFRVKLEDFEAAKAALFSGKESDMKRILTPEDCMLLDYAFRRETGSIVDNPEDFPDSFLEVNEETDDDGRPYRYITLTEASQDRAEFLYVEFLKFFE